MGHAYYVRTPMCQLSRPAFVTSIGVQCVKMSPLEHVTCAIEYSCHTIKVNVAYQNNSFHNGNGKQMTTPLDCNVRVFRKNKSIPFVPLCLMLLLIIVVVLQKRFFLTGNIENLGYCRTSVGITITICQMTLQFTLLYELTNLVTVIVRHLPYIVVTSTDMAASCKAVELRINP